LRHRANFALEKLSARFAFSRHTMARQPSAKSKKAEVLTRWNAGLRLVWYSSKKRYTRPWTGQSPAKKN